MKTSERLRKFLEENQNEFGVLTEREKDFLERYDNYLQQEENGMILIQPEWSEIARNISGYIACSCGTTLQTFEQTREHWQLGHFNYLIPKDKPQSEIYMLCSCGTILRNLTDIEEHIDSVHFLIKDKLNTQADSQEDYEEFIKQLLKKRSQRDKFILCSCGANLILLGEALEHWKLGHWKE